MQSWQPKCACSLDKLFALFASKWEYANCQVYCDFETNSKPFTNFRHLSSAMLNSLLWTQARQRENTEKMQVSSWLDMIIGFLESLLWTCLNFPISLPQHYTGSWAAHWKRIAFQRRDSNSQASGCDISTILDRHSVHEDIRYPAHAVFPRIRLLTLLTCWKAGRFCLKPRIANGKSLWPLDLGSILLAITSKRLPLLIVPFHHSQFIQETNGGNVRLWTGPEPSLNMEKSLFRKLFYEFSTIAKFLYNFFECYLVHSPARRTACCRPAR